jgi:hypothetical protein
MVQGDGLGVPCGTLPGVKIAAEPWNHVLVARDDQEGQQ